MDNEPKLVEVIKTTLAAPGRQQALDYVEGIKFKTRLTEHRLGKLKHEVKRYCTREEAEDFLYKAEFDHFVISIRSVLDYLAQLVNVVYRLELLPSHASGPDPIVNFGTVVERVGRKEPGNKLARLLKRAIRSKWYKYLNGLRIETVHVKPVPTAREMRAYGTSKAHIVTNVLAKRSDDETGETTRLPGVEAQPEEEEQPRGGIGPRIEKLLLPDKPSGHTWEKRIELVSYCEATLANTQGIVPESYAALIHRLEGSK